MCRCPYHIGFWVLRWCIIIPRIIILWTRNYYIVWSRWGGMRAEARIEYWWGQPKHGKFLKTPIKKSQSWMSFYISVSMLMRSPRPAVQRGSRKKNERKMYSKKTVKYRRWALRPELGRCIHIFLGQTVEETGRVRPWPRPVTYRDNRSYKYKWRAIISSPRDFI